MSPTDIPISAVAVGAEEERLVVETLRSGRLVQGPMVERFEAACAAMAGTQHAVAVSSGTTALSVTLEALDLEPGSVVLTSPFTFVATLNAILEAGYVARFVDIGDDFNLDPDALDAALDERTRVVLPVHLYGLAADLDRIQPLATRAGACLVEDAAQAHGARVGDRPVGGFGVGCFSFYATKNVTTGEGGAVTTDDEALDDRVRLLRNQGMRGRYQYELPGHNYRMTELQAALGIPGLEQLDTRLATRRVHAAALQAGLGQLEGIVIPNEPDGRTHAWHQFTIRVTDAARVSRDNLASELSARGIATGVYYPRPVFDYDCYRDHPHVHTGHFPTAEHAAREVLSLPVHPGLSEGDLTRIVETMQDLLG